MSDIQKQYIREETSLIRKEASGDILKKPSSSTLWVLLTSATLTIMAGTVIAPVLNLMREGLGIDPTSVGLIITAHSLFIAVFSPVMGSLIDRIGPKKPCVLGLFVYGVAGGAGLFIESYWMLIASRAFLGIALAALYNAITVIILNSYKGMQQNKIMGWRGSANSLGGIIYPVLGGFLGAFSWHLPFVIYTIGIPLGFLVIFFVPDIDVAKTPAEGSRSSVLRIFRTTPILYAIYGTMFLSNIMLYAIVIFLPQVLEMIGISDPLHISFFMSFMIFAAGVTSFNYSRIKATLSNRNILLLAFALWAAAFVIMSQATFSLLIFTALAFFGIGLGAIIPTIPVWIGEIVPAPFRGRFSSFMGTFGFIGQFISPIVFAPVLILVGLNGVFLVSAGVGILALIVLWILL